MKDEQEREQGRHIEVYEKVMNGVNQTITETTIVGKNFEVINFTREYNPGYVYKSETKE